MKVIIITHTIMIYGYIRVSSDKQTVENQRFEISNFCKHQNLSIDDWIEEIISGIKNYTKRQLGNLLKKVNKDDIIICSELSRLGRNLFMIMEILNICMTNEYRVWTIKDNYRLGDDIQSKVLAFAFGLSAEIERNLISQRTKEALAGKRYKPELDVPNKSMETLFANLWNIQDLQKHKETLRKSKQVFLNLHKSNPKIFENPADESLPELDYNIEMQHEVERLRSDLSNWKTIEDALKKELLSLKQIRKSIRYVVNRQEKTIAFTVPPDVVRHTMFVA